MELRFKTLSLHKNVINNNMHIWFTYLVFKYITKIDFMGNIYFI